MSLNVGFGQFKDTAWREVPTPFLMWILSPKFNDHHNAKVNAQVELTRRTGFVQNYGDPNSKPVFQANVREAGDEETADIIPDILTEREVFIIAEMTTELLFANPRKFTGKNITRDNIVAHYRKVLIDSCHRCYIWPDTDSIERMLKLVCELVHKTELAHNEMRRRAVKTSIIDEFTGEAEEDDIMEDYGFGVPEDDIPF